MCKLIIHVQKFHVLADDIYNMLILESESRTLKWSWNKNVNLPEVKTLAGNVVSDVSGQLKLHEGDE